MTGTRDPREAKISHHLRHDARSVAGKSMNLRKEQAISLEDRESPIREGHGDDGGERVSILSVLLKNLDMGGRSVGGGEGVHQGQGLLVRLAKRNG